MDLATVSGAGGTVEIGGKLLTLRQLNIGQVGEMQAWLKERSERPFQKAVRRLRDLAPLREFDPTGYEDARKDILLRARDEENGVLDPEQMAATEDLASGLDGVAYMLYLSTRDRHPDITHEWLRNALMGEDLGGIQTKLDAINQEWMRHAPQKKGAPNGSAQMTSPISIVPASKS